MQISLQEIDRLARTQGTRLRSDAVSNSTSKTVLGATPAAKIEISASAQEIQQVKSRVDALPDVREDLVSSLKASIESGNYRVSNEDIADLMVRRAQADHSF